MSGGVGPTVRHAYDGSARWRAHLEAAGIDVGDVAGPEDLDRLPFLTKADLRAGYPFDWACVPMRDVVRVHASSGTTGKRVLMPYTAQDLDDWTEQFARSYRYAGVGPDDRVQVVTGFGLWTAGAGFTAGAERVGAMVVPIGPGNIEGQLEFLLDVGSTVLCSTASFALFLAEEVERRGLRGKLALRRGLVGSERWGPVTRARIEEVLGIETFDIYGMTEMYGPGSGMEGPDHDGIHVWSDYFAVEIVEPGGDRVLPFGEEGEVVVTTLRKQALPLIRYRTGDLSCLLPPAAGPDGTEHARLAPIRGRTDDMVKIRGVQVMPAQIDTALATVEGVGGEYQIHLSRHEGRDVFLVRVEATVDRQPDAALADGVGRAVREATGLRADVEVLAHGSLPRSEKKTRRVFDTRDV